MEAQRHFHLEESHPAPKSWPYCKSFEVHLLPHPPMQDSEVVNVCVQKPNLSCKVYLLGS
ncbi:hypothetical protein I79_023294 [Cricetulus griseus]|uniref:Uncharacterized protein n=1 Tax=Cricetulus griseus TaxID=10029 RepID=G3IHK3_CRIGR|nr:hypothetical protein I79_023294 [Cricetulus griseus]